MTTENKYWIAINGPSCALSSLPWLNPVTVPVAGEYIGFPTLKEAQEAQSVCLHGSHVEMRKYFAGLQPAVEAGRVRVINPPCPQPCTDGPTMWMESTAAPTLVPILTDGQSQN